jgi:hypothetical protein
MQGMSVEIEYKMVSYLNSMEAIIITHYKGFGISNKMTI